MAHVLAEVADAIATVTLDHERRRNALSHALVEKLIGALQRFREARAPPAYGSLRPRFAGRGLQGGGRWTKR